MLSKVNIKYPMIYDMIFHKYENKQYYESSRKEGKHYAKRLQREWDKISKRVLLTMQHLSGLRWKNKEIDVYIIRYGKYSFSMPLIILMKKRY
jgi:hypothetical protein